MKYCSHHCRSCECCFTSLAAFDAHREGPPSELRRCTWPESANFVEENGACRISEPPTVRRKTIHSLPKTEAQRRWFKRKEGR